MQRHTTSTGSAETEAIGAEIAETLAPGDVVLIEGELGAGKTTFVRGALRALGVRGPITSPTFVVGHAYDGSSRPGSSLPMPASRYRSRCEIGPAVPS